MSAGDMEFFPSIPLPPNLPTIPLAIADMANLFGVTHRTLHFYEEKRLIRADRIGAMRIYGPQQVRIMALINLCRETGMPILQIQDLMADLVQSGSQEIADEIFRSAMLTRKRELMTDESLIRRQMQQINEILDSEQPDFGGDANDNRDDRAPFLSTFEFRCLGLMAEGYTPVRISNATGHSVEEILATESTIIRKFGSSNRFQAVAKAVLLGILGD